MKRFTCIFVVLLVAVCIYGDSSEDAKAKFREKFEKCKKEAGLPDERPKGPPNLDDPKQKCFHACLMKETGKMENGKMVAQKVINGFKKRMGNNYNDKVEENLTYCVETANEKTGDCEVAGTFAKCIFEKVSPRPQPKQS